MKCLSSRKFGCNTFSLIHVLKSIIVAKINFGIFLFGHSPKSTLNKLKTNFNSALRLSLVAFRTTPIRNLIFEADVLSIEQMREFATTKLFKSIMINDQYPLSKLFNKSIKQKNFFQIPSLLTRTVLITKNLNIPFMIK